MILLRTRLRTITRILYLHLLSLQREGMVSTADMCPLCRFMETKEQRQWSSLASFAVNRSPVSGGRPQHRRRLPILYTFFWSGRHLIEVPLHGARPSD
jgi:hypothetical protein